LPGDRGERKRPRHRSPRRGRARPLPSPRQAPRRPRGDRGLRRGRAKVRGWQSRLRRRHGRRSPDSAVPRTRAARGRGVRFNGLAGPIARAALSPLSALYGRALEARAGLYRSGSFASRRAACPVISVGNLTMGGTGKTPFVAFLARRLRFEGKRPAILSRGYGRRSRGVVVVSEGSGPLLSLEVGRDQPVALACALTVVVIVVAPR